MTIVNAGSRDIKGEVAGSDDVAEPQTVSYETYQKAIDQRKADQKKARDLQATLDAMNAEKNAADEQRLADTKKFEELYNKEKTERAKLQETLQSMTARQVENAKRDAVKAALGGVKKDDYLKFLDLSVVQLNDDGTADAESVKAAANKFRESYPELVAGKSGAKMANEAGGSIQPPPGRKLTEMPEADLRARLAAITAGKK
jgi:hypothetical protein